LVKLVDKQNIFNSGILSSKLYSRDDLKQYNNGVADAMNFVCSRYGPMEKRTGTQHIWDLGNPGESVYFLPFVFSINQTILLEFLHQRIRFYTFGTDENDNFGFGPLADMYGNHYTIVTPFTADMIKQISYVQSLDVLYITFSSGEYPPYKITRKDYLNWVVEKFETEDGPYLDQNFDTTKKVTITDKNTTTSTVALTNFSLSSADVGRWIRICTPRYNENTYAYEDKWSYGKISGLGTYVWSLNRKTIYTATDSPVVNTVTYVNAAKSTQWGKVTAVGTVGETLTITSYGKVYVYREAVVDGVYAWTEATQNMYVNDNESARTIVYSAAAAPAASAKVYTDLNFTNSTTAYSTLSAATGTEVDKKFFNTANGEKFYYVGTATNSGGTVRYKWKQASYIYSNNTYTTRIGSIYSKAADTIIAQMDSATASTATIDNRSTFSRIGSTITVDWSYRNIVDETDQSWMTQATSEWRLGVWHSGTGNSDFPVTYPTKVTIHQQRLVWAGVTDRPWIWMSNSFAYKNYAPSDYEGEISDTNSIYYDISSSKISEIFWLASVKSLLIGTELGEIRMYSAGTALTPSDVVSNMESSYGSYNGDPVTNDDNIVFIQRLQRTVRSLSYDYNQDAFVGPELTVLAEGLTVGGIKRLAFQKEPNNTYWCLKEDGSLLSLTYDKAQDVIGWSRSKLAGTEIKVIDIAVLPSNAYMQDVLLLCTERKVNGVTKRFLELLSRNFNKDIEQKDVLYLDDAMRIRSTTAMTTVTGLDHLEGETVRVLDEGALEGDYVVEDGEITLSTPCKDIWVGLPYDAYFETLERDYQDKQISTKMSKLRVYKLRMYIERTLGIQLKRLDRGSESKLITFDPTSLMDTAPALITGRVDIPVGSAWDCDYRLRIESEPGFPCTVSGLIMGIEINEL